MRNRGWIAALTLLLAIGFPVCASAAETTETAEKDASKFDMSKGGPTWSFGNTSLTFGMFVQARFTAEDKEEFDLDAGPITTPPTPATEGFGEPDGISTGFKLPRIRLGMRGTLFQPWVKYAVTYELSDTSGERDAKFKDAFVEFTRVPLAGVRLGQYKVPFSLQELCGDQNQLFLERAITNVFALGRDQGATLGGRTESKTFGYAVGVFNGSGESRSQDDEGMVLVGRAFWDPFGEYRLTESAQEAPDQHLLHLGAAYRTGEAGRGTATQGAFEDPNGQDAFNVEAAWKWRRWYATAEYFQQTTEFENPVASPDVDADGFHVQGSFLAIPKKLEFGARFAEVDGNSDSPDAKTTEIRGVVNYYWWGDNLKLQFDLGTLEFQPNAPGRNLNGVTLTNGTRLVPGDVTDVVARLQVQFGF